MPISSPEQYHLDPDMSAEASTSAAASTEGVLEQLRKELPKEFYDSVVMRNEPPPYMLNTPLKKRVYHTFIDDWPAIDTLGKLRRVADELGCTGKEEPPSTSNDRHTEAEFTWEGNSIKISGRKTKDDSPFTCEIVKDDETVYQSYYTDGVLYEKQAPRSSGQTFEDRPFERCSFYSIRDSKSPKERSFRLWAEPDPDNEKTLLAGFRDDESYQVVAFRPNHGIVFRHKHNFQDKSDKVYVRAHGGGLMWHSDHTIMEETDVWICNSELIKSECQKWAALDNASDADLAAFVQAEKVTTEQHQHGRRDFFSEPGEYHAQPKELPKSLLLELMDEAATWGDLPRSRDAEGPSGSGYHSDYPDSLTDGTDSQASSESSETLGDDSHGHPSGFQDNVNQGGQPKRPRLV